MEKAGFKTFDCQFCSKTFCDNYKKRRHERTHTGERPFSCKTCGRAFDENHKLKRHELVHSEDGKKPYACHLCPKSYIEKYGLNMHMKIHASEVLHGTDTRNCLKICDTSIEHKSGTEVGKETGVHEVNSSAHIFREVHVNSLEFKEQGDFQNDLNMQSKNIDVSEDIVEHKEDENFLCNDSSNPLESESINIKAKDSPTEESVEKDMENENSKHICSKNDKVLEDKYSQDVTYEIQNTKDNDVSEIRQNKLSQIQIGSQEESNAPIVIQAAETKENDEEIEEVAQENPLKETETDCHSNKGSLFINESMGKFSCNFCDKRFIDNYSLKRHVRSHTGEKPFPCKLCDKSFGEKYKLKRHEMVVHAPGHFPCSHCDVLCRSKFELVTHEITHTGKKPFSCKKCDKSFVHKHHLKTHEKLCFVKNTATTAKDKTLDVKPTIYQNRPPTDPLEVPTSAWENLKRINAREIINSIILPPDAKRQLLNQIESALENEKIPCPFCRCKFVSGSSLLKHAERYHAKSTGGITQQLTVRNVYSCNAGQQPFAQEANLNGHKVVNARTVISPSEDGMILPHSTSYQSLMQIESIEEAVGSYNDANRLMSYGSFDVPIKEEFNSLEDPLAL